MPKGNYMHEQALMDAYKRLYMLGGTGRGRRKAAEKSLDESMVGAASGTMSAYQAKLQRDRQAAERLKAQLDAKRKQEAADAEQEADDVRYIKEGPEAFREFQQVRAGQAVPQNPYKEELARQAADREAAMTRIGGVYTPQGLKMADKEANLNAQDRLMMRSLVQGPQPGLGGSAISTPGPGPSMTVPNQPPNAMDKYRIPQ